MRLHPDRPRGREHEGTVGCGDAEDLFREHP